MKRFGIVDIKTGVMQTWYESEEVDRQRFGGPWSYPDCCRHIEIREDAYDLPADQVEVRNIQVQVGTQMVQNGEVEARDAEGDVILDSNGDPLMVPDYEKVPVYAQEDRIIPKT